MKKIVLSTVVLASVLSISVSYGAPTSGGNPSGVIDYSANALNNFCARLTTSDASDLYNTLAPALTPEIANAARAKSGSVAILSDTQYRLKNNNLTARVTGYEMRGLSTDKQTALLRRLQRVNTADFRVTLARRSSDGTGVNCNIMYQTPDIKTGLRIKFRFDFDQKAYENLSAMWNLLVK